MSSSPNANDDIRLTIVDLDDEGAGLARREAAGPDAATEEVHVAGALPGEDIVARVAYRSPHARRAWADLVSIAQPAPDRVDAVCPAHGHCGGCVLQHLAYPSQLRWKEGTFRRQAAEHGIAEIGGGGSSPVTSIVASPKPFEYRNNSKLVPTRRPGDDRLRLGAYAPRTHEVVDLAGCRLVERPLDDIAVGLRDILDAHAVSVFDERSRVGVLRYVVLRSNARGEVLVTLVTARDDLPHADAIVADLRAACPAVVGVVQNVNATSGNVLFGEHERTLFGEPTLVDEIAGVRLRISSRAFLQTNREVAALAYETIRRELAVTRNERVVDAYAGVGGIGLTLARDAREVIGIEFSAAAVADAGAAAALNGIDNTRFVAGDAAERLRDIDAADVVVLNPPRKGCAPAVLDAVVALRPRAIAYLSCSPLTLLRDLALLGRAGYVTHKLTPFDMLPHTPHLEVLAFLSRAA